MLCAYCNITFLREMTWPVRLKGLPLKDNLRTKVIPKFFHWNSINRINQTPYILGTLKLEKLFRLDAF